MNIMNKKHHHYTALFCEENIWKLVESSMTSNIIVPIDVLFIINKSNSIALFKQNTSDGEQAVIWDYHVVLSAQVNKQTVIFDFDSRCNFPTSIHSYFNKTFANYNALHDHYKPLIKPIPANYYYHNFTSNRQHMKGIIAESEFPDYDIIMPENTANLLTLDTCRTLTRNFSDSVILTPIMYLEHLKTRIETGDKI